MLEQRYPGNTASRADIAAWMGRSVQRLGLPPELPVMAALVESGLTNVNYGDSGSVGFFQMRVGIWNKGDYKGYPEDPVIQMRWFADRALEVRQDEKSGEPAFRGDPASYGLWIADIERPDDPHYVAADYQSQLWTARQLLGAGCPGRV